MQKVQQQELLEQLSLGQSLSTDEEISDKAQAIILSAKQYLGVSYVWGGTITTGFNCSGLSSGYLLKME
ncbi:hypothetical protein [Enterococcus sp. AZ072]|uniref:hypothetical protein n=1 Tax=unclassified Enterococcus TaxID=2608891 RepID=UPI003D27DBCB